MNSQIDEFEQIMLDYQKGEISSEDMQKLTILLKRENVCREKYREIARSYALASSSWFARRKERNLEQLRDTLNFHSSRMDDKRFAHIPGNFEISLARKKNFPVSLMPQQSIIF